MQRMIFLIIYVQKREKDFVNSFNIQRAFSLQKNFILLKNSGISFVNFDWNMKKNT
jgi:hypothetical protein